MAVYLLVKVAKFLAVFVYASSLHAAFVTREARVQKALVHRVASPALLVVWLSGYALSYLRGVPLTEFWPLAGLLLSLVSQLALVYSAAKARQDAKALASASAPLFLVVVLMVFKPTWQGLFG